MSKRNGELGNPKIYVPFTTIYLGLFSSWVPLHSSFARWINPFINTEVCEVDGMEGNKKSKQNAVKGRHIFHMAMKGLLQLSMAMNEFSLKTCIFSI